MCNSCKPTVTFQPMTTSSKPTTTSRSIGKKPVKKVHQLKAQPLHYVNSPAHRMNATKRRLELNVKNDSENDCCICLESLTGGQEHIYVTPCGHKYHRSCLKEMAATSVATSCALCRTPIKVKGVSGPDPWYMKYQGKPGYRWLDKYLANKALEKEFDDLIGIIEVAVELEN